MKRIAGKILQHILIDSQGVAMAISALMLPALIGMGALAVDVGYMYVAKSAMQTAVDAGARAGGAILAMGGTQTAAEAEARIYVNQNNNGSSFLQGATATVTFPTTGSIQVGVAHTLPLFFAPVVGVDVATIDAGATAKVAPVRAISPGNLVPFGIYCNNAGGCASQLSVDQVFSGMRRHCGNVFGASGSSCNYSSSTPVDSEIFLTGLTFNSNNSNGELKNEVEEGYSGTAALGDVLGALPGTRQGWQSAMRNRLNAGNAEMTLPVISPVDSSNGSVEIVDFIQVRISSFLAGSASEQDQFSFEIIPTAVSSTEFADDAESLGIDSVQGVRLTN